MLWAGLCREGGVENVSARGLLGKVKAAEQGLETGIGAEGVPVASDGEMADGSFVGIDGFFEPGEREIVLRGVRIEAGNSHAGDMGMLCPGGEHVATALHGFPITGGGEAGV